MRNIYSVNIDGQRVERVEGWKGVKKEKLSEKERNRCFRNGINIYRIRKIMGWWWWGGSLK